MVYLKGLSTLTINSDKCTGCGVCIQVCPRGVIEMRSGIALSAIPDACIECGACQLNCRHDAIIVRAGVGCASALINAKRTGGEPCCGPSSVTSNRSSCC
ncbi:MAG: 4Fe-4S binding protein [Spirochaetales bacterium]|nr:4Fe-4S binding protein [Spirochaetales bacterium]